MFLHLGNTDRACPSLVDVLRWRAQHQGDRLAYRFLLDGEQDEASVSYGELDWRARAIGCWLQEKVRVPGQPVVLLSPPGLDFISAFFGCLYGGMIAVPAYPPHPARRPRTWSWLEAL